jgi:hypothetical protein
VKCGRVLFTASVEPWSGDKEPTQTEVALRIGAIVSATVLFGGVFGVGLVGGISGVASVRGVSMNNVYADGRIMVVRGRVCEGGFYELYIHAFEETKADGKPRITLVPDIPRPYVQSKLEEAASNVQNNLQEAASNVVSILFSSLLFSSLLFSSLLFSSLLFSSLLFSSLLSSPLLSSPLLSSSLPLTSLSSPLLSSPRHLSLSSPPCSRSYLVRFPLALLFFC